MIIRFLAFWLLITLIVSVWVYFTDKDSKQLVKRIVKGFIFSGIVSSILIVVAMFINNFQGI